MTNRIHCMLILVNFVIIIAGNLASGPYFTEAVAAVRGDKEACTLLGEPVRVLALRLGDKGNKVTTEHAQVSCIGLVGC